MTLRIVEVGPRDGLQNEKTPIPTDAKLAFINALIDAGLREIEATSFVSPKWVPQLGDAAELWPQLPVSKALFSALVPNAKGLERALEVGVGRIALFTAASDAFTQKNINMTVSESVAAFKDVIDQFRAAQKPAPSAEVVQTSPSLIAAIAASVIEPAKGGWVRGYVSTAFECPYAGRISPKQTAIVVHQLLALGCDEVSLGDTIGVATPTEVKALASELSGVAREKIAWHFHDTRGTAVSNIACALELGYGVFDSSAAGLGGCPYAPGAGGNLATEDLVYFLEREGIGTGVDPIALANASLPTLQLLGKSPSAKAQLATLSAC